MDNSSDSQDNAPIAVPSGVGGLDSADDFLLSYGAEESHAYKLLSSVSFIL